MIEGGQYEEVVADEASAGLLWVPLAKTAGIVRASTRTDQRFLVSFYFIRSTPK